MNTSVIKVSEELTPEDNSLLDHAAGVIRAGGLVAFPTETVYGLGANGMDPRACAKIYEAKGRPSDNPLILHISDMSQLHDLAAELNAHGKTLAAGFWPGPLTLVTGRTNRVPDIVSGGLDTVAVRMPSSSIARALINKSGVPIAAPSANVSGRPSSTRAEHVAADLSGKIDMIVDGGSSVLGLESTIVDVSGEVPCLLRPGTITLDDIESAVGRIEIDPAVNAEALSGSRPKAPGMAYVHYAPQAELVIVAGELGRSRKQIFELVRARRENAEFSSSPTNIAIVTTDENIEYYQNMPVQLFSLGKRSHPAEIAANLYDVLRALDQAEITHAFSEGFDETGVGLSIMNRLKKAAGYRVVRV
ncbi:MAG: L-threonylcarbamoyladenylate synthase [Defluviitaleaceae bacterium]|nr:L-threonylcarbamoyladenylate synthase [Defluviitaleaceae bacterium]